MKCPVSAVRCRFVQRFPGGRAKQSQETGEQDPVNPRNASTTKARRRELPVARERSAELQTCAYCPRLCRAVCPVSNAEPREALIPWGKMVSLLSDESRGVQAEPWGCTGCGACTELCRHNNPVADVLIEGRASVFTAGQAPPAAVRVAQEHPGRLLRHFAKLEDLCREIPTDPAAPLALLLGCGTLESSPSMAEDVLSIVARLASGPIRVLSECCGLVPQLAGDAAGALLVQQRLGRSLRGVERLIVADPGCGQAVERFLAEQGRLGRRVEHTSLLAWVSGHGNELRAVGRSGARYAWQPPCWARGTAAEPAARVLLKQLVGDFVESTGRCSGGGGLVPSVFPQISRRIAATTYGGLRDIPVDVVVAGCASSARRLRAAAEPGGPEIVELTALLRDALSAPPGEPCPP